MNDMTPSGIVAILMGTPTVLMINLRLDGLIAWSWRWVLAPIWVPLLGLLAICGGIGVVFFGAWCIDLVRGPQPRRKPEAPSECRP